MASPSTIRCNKAIEDYRLKYGQEALDDLRRQIGQEGDPHYRWESADSWSRIRLSSEEMRQTPEGRKALARDRRSRILIGLDRFCEFVPGLATVTNLVNIFQKIFGTSCSSLERSEYDDYLKNKSFCRCVILMLTPPPLTWMGLSIEATVADDGASAGGTIARSVAESYSRQQQYTAQQSTQLAQSQLRGQEIRNYSFKP